MSLGHPHFRSDIIQVFSEMVMYAEKTKFLIQKKQAFEFQIGEKVWGLDCDDTIHFLQNNPFWQKIVAEFEEKNKENWEMRTSWTSEICDMLNNSEEAKRFLKLRIFE
jgi:hypothetical protein